MQTKRLVLPTSRMSEFIIFTLPWVDLIKFDMTLSSFTSHSQYVSGTFEKISPRKTMIKSTIRAFYAYFVKQ